MRQCGTDKRRDQQDQRGARKPSTHIGASDGRYAIIRYLCEGKKKKKDTPPIALTINKNEFKVDHRPKTMHQLKETKEKSFVTWYRQRFLR